MSERTPPRAIAEYAAHFHAALGPVHAAASPLAAWMRLAYVARRDGFIRPGADTRLDLKEPVFEPLLEFNL